MMLGWRDICRSTDERTMIATKLGYVATGHNLPLLLVDGSADEISGLQAVLSSFVFDYVSRQIVGGTHLTFFILAQLPIPSPNSLNSSRQWIFERVERLNSQQLDADTIAILRAELDALMFHIYGIVRDDVDYILETFPIVKKKDEAAHGEYRTKRLILEKYDELAASQ